MEVFLRGGFGAEHALAPFHVVQVDLQDALFGQQQFQRQGQHELLPLAQQGALARKQQVLGQLLGEGGAADDLRGLRRRGGFAGRGLARRPGNRLERWSTDVWPTPQRQDTRFGSFETHATG